MRGTPVLFDSFDGGLNEASAPYEVKPNESRSLVNVVGTARGGVKRRNCCPAFSTSDPTGAARLGLFGVRSVAAAGFVSAGDSGTQGVLQRIDTAGVVSNIKTGLSRTARWKFVEAPVSGGQGPVYGMNGTDTPQQYSGVAGATADWTASSGTLPNGRFMVVAGNRIFVAGVAATPNRLFFSEIGDPRIWPAANQVDIDPNDGGAITGLGVVGSLVLVFKAERLYAVYNLDSGANRRISREVGSSSPNSIVETPIGALFLANDGVYSTDGSNVKKLSDRVQPTIDALTESLRAIAAGVYFNHHYYLCLLDADVTTTAAVLDYDFHLQSWWRHNNMGIHHWAVNDVGSGPELFAVGFVGRSPISGPFGRMCRMFQDGATFDGLVGGNAPVGSWSSAFHHFGQPALHKHLRQLHLDGIGIVNVSVTMDFGGSAVTELATFDGPGSVDEIKMYTIGPARAFSMTIANAVNDFTLWELESYTMSIGWRKD